MEYPELVRDLLAEGLPPDILARVDLAGVVPVKDSFVDGELRMEIPDFVFVLPLKPADASVPSYQGKGHATGGSIYVVVEHLTRADRMVGLRMQRYVLGVTQMVCKQQGLFKKGGPGSRFLERPLELPLVIPLVLYTGSRPFRYGLDLIPDFGSQADVASTFWGHKFFLVNVPEIADEELEKRVWLGPAALATKHAPAWSKAGLHKALKPILKGLQVLEKVGASDYIQVALAYLAQVGNFSDKTSFRAYIESVLKEDARMKTIWDAFQEEGRLKGRREGKLEGKREGKLEGKREGKREAFGHVARNLMAEGMPVHRIAQVTGLPVHKLKGLVGHTVTL